MPETKDYEALLVEHLPYIEKMAGRLCRRDGLDPDETDDFISWARERLIENDYAALRKWREESALTTYLTVVLSMLYRDHRVARWGRWRPSAEARRQGVEAVALERLVHRDHFTVAEAVRRLRESGETTMSERELFVVFGRLPSGPRGRPMSAGDMPLAHAASLDQADHELLTQEADAERVRVNQVLMQVVEGLPPEDGVIVRMRFLEGMSVAEIARTLLVEQKPLYRRLERVLARLRGELEAAGISRESLTELAGEDEK
jgi:RNA polymerase sigma factor for flagellar operon FliA